MLPQAQVVVGRWRHHSDRDGWAGCWNVALGYIIT
jgi:hypothetical protein